MIAHTDLTLFQNTKFYKHQNYKIDDIATFLSGFTDKLEFEDLQYFKVDSLQKEIKISFNQKGIKDLHKYNYARVVIINADESTEWTLYYFVDKVEWISMDCVKLHMTLDTLNSFLDMLEFHPKTFIEREHCDRWILDNPRAYHHDLETDKWTFLRNIPELNEGLNPQKYTFGFKSKKLISINKASAFYVCENDYKDKSYGWAMVNISLDKLYETALYEFNQYDFTIYIPFENYSFQIAQNVGTIPSTLFRTIDCANQKLQSINIIPYAPENNLSDYHQYRTQENAYQGGEYYKGIKIEKDAHGIELNGVSMYYRNERNKSPINHISNYLFESKDILPSLYNFNDIMRYFFTMSFNGEYDLINMIRDNGFFKDSEFTYKSIAEFSNESSLYSSEFFQLGFSYDTNEYNFGLEDVKFNDTKNLDHILNDDDMGFLNIYFTAPGYNDRSMFFSFEMGDGFDYDRKKENDEVMICPITSQIPLTTSEYRNYMLNGYNYDIKIRDSQRQERALERNDKWVNRIIGSATTINPLKNIRNIGQSIYEGTYSDAQHENLTRMQEDLQMEKNLAQLKASKVQTSQIDGGIDKMRRITRNFLNFNIMAPRKSWWKYLEDYFYFFGNKVQYYGIPSHNNRCLFDYLKCKAEFVNRNSIPNEESLNDIIQRLASGVTFIHRYLNQYTFDSDYKENVERQLIEILKENK